MIRMKAFMAAAVVIATAFTATAAEQETLQHVKELYASAAYEDALGVLARLQSPDQRLEIERYRAYCLIALDRPAEAEKAILGILSEDPAYSPEDAAPRVVDLFKRVKREATPQLARTLYNDGKAAMASKDQERAIRKFEQLLQLTQDGDIRNDTLISELRLLAAGFLDLARATAPAEATKPTATATIGTIPPPKMDAVPPLPTNTVPAAAPSNTASGRPGAPASPPGAVVVTPPVPLRQDLPRWVPYDNASRQAEYRGAIKVTISVDGKVQAAEIVTPTDRLYDRQLLNAARSWLYEPAKRDGVPIVSEKIVAVYLRPR
jgi:tetratricopeptide (TPR) repeat protein